MKFFGLARLVGFVLVLVLGFVAGCAEPEPTPLERAHEISRTHEEARDRASEEGKARVAAGMSQPAATPGRMKRELLAKYGAQLTPFQRSALQSARLSTYAEGEAMCVKWIEENRRFERQR